MNSKTWTRIIALGLFSVLAVPIQLTAQTAKSPPRITITTSYLTLARSARTSRAPLAPARTRSRPLRPRARAHGPRAHVNF